MSETGQMLDQDWQKAGFGLYFHWPFCQSKCPYCDFNSHVQQQVDQDAWCAAFLREIERIGVLTKDRIVSTVYFGGGTPSLMPASTVDAILNQVQRTWRLRNDIEITLEANPTSIETSKLLGFKAAGVNRVSVGVQALNDADLRRLGRMHSRDEAKEALAKTASTFDRYSFDLIYARQFQTLKEWEKELADALSYGSDHLSLYQLTIEDGTVFGERHAKGMLKGLPTDDLGADFYELTQEMTEAAGLPAYEVSNHARPGAESQHNLIYWNSGDFAGIGPGAHGRLTLDGTRYATLSTRMPNSWLTEATTGQPSQPYEALDAEARATEFLMMGLRVRDGISIMRFMEHSERDLPKNAIDELLDMGMIALEDGMLKTTAKGRPLLNAILLKLLSE